MQVKTLNRKAQARLPNKISRNVAFDDLSPIAFKLLLYIVYLWNQTRRDAQMGSSPWGGEQTITVTWAELASRITPESRRGLEHGIYDTFRAALTQLVRVQISHTSFEGEKFKVREVYNLLAGWRYDEEEKAATILLHSKFARILEIVAKGGDFTLVPLQDAFALSSTRQVRLLLWAASFVHIRSESIRTVSLQTFRDSLGFHGRYYEAWSRVKDDLWSHLKEVNTRTRYRVKLVPVKQGREVVALRFDVLVKETADV